MGKDPWHLSATCDRRVYCHLCLTGGLSRSNFADMFTLPAPGTCPWGVTLDDLTEPKRPKTTEEKITCIYAGKISGGPCEKRMRVECYHPTMLIQGERPGAVTAHFCIHDCQTRKE